MIPNPFLGSGALLESKIADFRPKNRNFWKPIWPKFLHVGVRPAPKIFSGPGYPKSISKKNFGFLTQNESRIMKKIYPPPKKKGPFFGGGVWNGICTFRQVNGEQHVPDGCIYMPHTLGSGNQVPKVCFDAILGKKNFWKFYSQILREIGLKVGFGTHFRGVIKFVLGVLYSKYGHSERGRGRLKGFWGRRTPKSICTQQAQMGL